MLDDGASLILKLCNHETDLSMLIPGRIMPLDVQLWQDGHLDRLPEVMGHAVRGAWQEDGFWVLAMDDLGDRLLSYASVVSRGELDDDLVFFFFFCGGGGSVASFVLCLP